MLASLDDLIAIGGLKVNADEPLKSRALRLLELAGGQVCAYLGSTEVLLTPALTADQLTSLAAIVAECASNRLNRSMASNVDSYTGTGYESVLLNRWHKQQIDQLIGRPGQGSVSVSVDRDPNTSGLTYSPHIPWWLRTPIGPYSSPSDVECFDQIP